LKNSGQWSVVRSQRLEIRGQEPGIGCRGWPTCLSNSWVRGKYVFLAICLFFCCSSFVAAADVNDLLFQGADYHYKENLEQAIIKFEAVTSIDPKNEYAHNQLGILYAKKNRYEEAFKEFATVAKLDDNNTFAILWLGILHLRNGEMNNAFEKFNKIIQIDPNNADAYYFLGTLYNFRHNPAMAIEYLKKARDADSQEADTHFRLAKAFHNVDMIANAMLEYMRAIEIKPNYTKATNEIGWIYYNKGDKEGAISQWKKTLTINNKDRDSILNLAKAYNDLAWDSLKSGKTEEAIKYWGKTIAINPGNKAAKYYLGKYSLKSKG